METRRSLITKTSLVGLSVIAGCTATKQSTPLEIAIVNNSRASHEVTVQLGRNETKVYEQTIEIEEGEPDAKTTTTTLQFESIRVGDEYQLGVGLNGEEVKISTVQVDCTAEDGGEQFGVRITSDDTVTIHDSNC